MPSKLKSFVLTLSFISIVLALTACPGVIIDHIQVGFIPGNFVGATGIFECTSPVADKVLTFRWTFGDGNSAEGKVVTHSYSSEGVFVVRCTIVTETAILIYATTVSIQTFAGGGVAGPVFAYYGNFTSHTIRRCDVAAAVLPCTSELVADSGSGVVNPNDIEVVGTEMYWSDNQNRILKCDLTGGFPCASTLVARGITPRPDQPPIGVNDPRGIALNGNTLYWVNEDNKNIMSCDISGALPCTIFELIADAATSGVSKPDELVIDGTKLIWTESATRRIRSCTLTGPKPCQSQLLANIDSPITGSFGIASLGGILFWFDNNAEKIYACIPTSTPCTGVLIADGPTSGVSNPRALAFRGFTIYWANASQIRSCNLINADSPCQSTLNATGDIILSSIDVE